jgi:hypothetical protein
MAAISMNFALHPLSHIDISIFRFPNPSSMFFVLEPFPRIVLSIIPIKLPNFGAIIVDELALVNSFGGDLDSLESFGAHEDSFENPVESDEDSFAVHLIVPYISEV